MKTINEIKNMISENLSELDRAPVVTKKIENSVIKKNKFLNDILMYLETNPNPEFLIKEKQRIQGIISSKEDQFEYWSKNICDKSLDVSKRKSTFDRELGIPNLKRQLKTINFIL